MPFPNPSAANREAWIEQYFIDQWTALEALYNAIVAGSPGGATEATLSAFKTENNDNLIDAISFLSQIHDDLNTSGTSAAQWLMGIFTSTQNIDFTMGSVARGYAIPGSTNAVMMGFASSGTVDLQDEIDEVTLQINTQLSSMVGANEMYSGGQISICTYLDGVLIKYRAVATLMVNG